jgi:hypothetical protein
MSTYRIPFRTRPFEWQCTYLGNMCKDGFRHWFQLPPYTRRFLLCVSDKPVEGEGVYRCRFARNGWGEPEFKFWNERTATYERLPLMMSLRTNVTQLLKVSFNNRNWNRPQIIYVWVEHD